MDDNAAILPPDAVDVTAEEVVARRTASLDRAEEWALVLAAVGVPYRVVRQESDDRPSGYVLAVAAPDLPAAARALRAYDAESPGASPVAPPAPNRGTAGLGVGVALGLAGFAFRTGYWENDAPSRWFVAGVADASRIRAGEWWRAVTAMTLHADVMHLFGNMAASLIFIGAAGRWLGPGIAAWLILLAGTGANLLTAIVERQGHLSVGASTATFAALGVVVGLQVVRRWRGGGPIRRRAWVAAGAGLALLAMLGMGARADVFAHAFGLGLGCVLGVAAGAMDRPRAPGVRAPGGAARVSGVVAQLGLAAAALGAVAAAWARALAGEHGS